MTVLRITNDYSFLLTNNGDLKHTLWKGLRFKTRNYFMNPLYKQHLWDGFYDFFNKQTGKFLTGLVPEIKLALHYLNEKYDIVDERTQVKFLYERVDDQFMNEWLPEGMDPITLKDFQVDLINMALLHNRGIVGPPTGTGKAQPLDSLVLTPKGFQCMGSLHVGDMVCVPSGGYAPITGIFPQGDKSILKITFSNGDTVECCEDHLWMVSSISSGWKNKIFTARELADTFTASNGRKRYNLELPDRVDMECQSIPLDPYFMGLLLGDGCFRQKKTVKITNIEPEIIDFIKNLLLDGFELKPCNRPYDYRIAGRRGRIVNPYVKIVEELGLHGLKSDKKFIPACYTINSYDNRLALLQGLMDTDGYVSKTGGIEFSSTSPYLSSGVKWLVQSLGGIAWSRTCVKYYTYKGVNKKGKLCHIISFTLPEGVLPFRLAWKAARCNLRHHNNKTRLIVNIEQSGTKPCQCIMVDHPDHLYITDNFVVTHNTYIMLGIMKCLPPGTPILFLANRKGIVRQNYKEMIKWGFQNVGIFDGNNHKPNLITCSTVQSLHHLGKLLPKFKVLIVDEVHMMMGATAIKAYKKLTGCCVRIAVSATPFKFEQRKKDKTKIIGGDNVHKYNVKGYFGPVFEIESVKGGVLTTEIAQERGILSPSKCFFYPIDEPDNIQFDIYQDAVTNGIAQNWQFHKTVQKLVSTLKGRTLILVDRLAHGDTLQQLIPNSLWVQGKDNDETRDYVIKALTEAKGNIVAIATQQIFNAAINVFIHNLINAAGGKAEHDIIQRMGRGLRTADDKEILNYYDFMFRTNNYLEDHSRKRLRILKEEGHEIILKDNLDFMV